MPIDGQVRLDLLVFVLAVELSLRIAAYLPWPEGAGSGQTSLDPRLLDPQATIMTCGYSPSSFTLVRGCVSR